MKKVSGAVEILEVGPGATWGELYDYLEPYGGTAVGSRESSVGLGGFITSST
jgi:FAD/FMN-containing dehydrogenase